MARALRILRAPLEPLQHVAGLVAYHTRPRTSSWGKRQTASTESLQALMERLEGK